MSMTIECSIAIIKKSNKYLFSLRSKNPFLDYFEFPGGKIEKGESPEDTLDRECFEELGINIIDKVKIGSFTHLYDDFNVKLHIFCIKKYRGDIKSKESQILSYLNPLDMSQKFIESTYRIINYMQLPRYLSILSDEAEYTISNIQSQNNIENMFRLRSFGKTLDNYFSTANDISTLCNNTKLILDAKYYEFYHDIRYDGLHFTSYEINNMKPDNFKRRHKNITYSASCHNLNEISIANKMNLDFILLSPVLKDKHNVSSMGWNKFRSLSQTANMPVFALGGVKRRDLETCVLNYGYGVSGISNFK
tara:strand:- start:385 stop:1302 length:918 start_codon:yes stop_codon:yes gene_type:complete